MPRTVALFALILMLLTGLVLGQMSSLGQKPVQIAARSDSGAAETARAFYRAINLYLETGEREGLEQLMAPGFVGHAPHHAVDESADVFMQYLESLRSTFPGLQLEVSDLSAQAGTLAVDVKLVGNTAGAFAGLPLDAGAGVSGYEVLRVEGHQIAERWGSREMPPLFLPVIHADVSIPAGTFAEPRIERLNFDPNGFLEFIDYDGFILIAESGAITHQVVSRPEGDAYSATTPTTGNSDSPHEERESVELAPGESIAVPAGVRFRVQHTGSGMASALMVSIRQAQFATRGMLPYEVIESTGVERTLVTGGGVVPASQGNSTTTISLGKIVLPPGSVFPRHTTGDAELLVVVDGQIEVAVSEGMVVRSQPGKGFEVIQDVQTIRAGEGARANPGAAVEYRAGSKGPATLWVVTIRGDAV